MNIILKLGGFVYKFLVMGTILFGMSNVARASWSDGINRNDLINSIEHGSGLSHDEAVKVVDQVARATQTTDPDAPLPIAGYLYSSGFHFSLFLDSWTWSVDANVLDENRNLVSLPQIYDMYFQDGGFKADIDYKWMFIFAPTGMDLRRLDGAVFGRGIGVTNAETLGFEAAWLPGENRAGSMYQLAILVGAGAGLEFPRMTFKLREVAK